MLEHQNTRKARTMHFALKPENWTPEAASLWGDLLALNRSADFEEAVADFNRGDFGGQFADYFDGEKYKGPCSLGVSVEDRDNQE